VRRNSASSSSADVRGAGVPAACLCLQKPLKVTSSYKEMITKYVLNSRPLNALLIFCIF